MDIKLKLDPAAGFRGVRRIGGPGTGIRIHTRVYEQNRGYKIVKFSSYKVHQRLAHRMRAGRFLLAADAAHCKLHPDSSIPPSDLSLCNPFGGLGLTGGIVDVGGLYDCLSGIFPGEADESILDIYDQVRRSKYNDIVNPVSSETAVEDSAFLKTCKQAETGPKVAAKMSEGLNALQYDFRQHYRR
ncbi:hypothetical protein ASPVEDRAFT_27513 [Aspergillus versicolor CBS 583.65]|uniref:FAD-binding domain-containing protein n=1 Tax=Aspergillus versicolor CBS 583.65 TaxID=1036611 RepID=A0A1L9PH16_ASPVE|nr:uncharacterized protein ASPVEDRAFT_27513 [Aspergillus versicolor CBS 583.65]OJJ00801.1 hypothetical protein ASPVEDRAFT_27513 [Aspergillus versicolor CBS 583.65]